MGMLIVARAIQGLGAGALIPLAMIMIGDSSRRPSAVAGRG